MSQELGFRKLEGEAPFGKVKVFTLDEISAEEGIKISPEEGKKAIDNLNVTMPEQEVLQYYKSHERFNIGEDAFAVPFSGDLRDHYLEHPNRVSEMDFSVAEIFKINENIDSFSRRFIEMSISKGKKITNGRVMSIAGYDPDKNILTVREAGYFDSFSTNNAGLDISAKNIIEKEFIEDNVSYENLRSLESPNGELRSFDKSCLANVIGVGGIMVTADGFLVFPQRRTDLGPTSLGGKFALSASGVVDWDQRKLDELGIQGYLGSTIEKEVMEELALKSGKINLDKLFLSSIEHYIESETGIKAKDECQINPVCFSRDLIRGGKPQMFYFIQTVLTSDQIPGRMIEATDSKKEFTQVNMFPLNKDSLKLILGNGDKNFIFNHEARGVLGLMCASEKGKNILGIK